MTKSYISNLRSDWKYFLQTDQGIKSKLTTHGYTSSFLYPQSRGVVPKKIIKQLLQRFYKERIVFIPKEKELNLMNCLRKLSKESLGGNSE